MTAETKPGAFGRMALRCQPDSRLVALTREGSDAAFEEVVGRYRGRLVGFAAGIVPSHRAEDVVQESLVRALASIRDQTADADINLRPWLYTIVRNRALNALRDEPRHEHLDESYDGVPQPPEVAARREELAGVVKQVKALPDAQREALVQRELGGRSHEEIAQAMAVTAGAVRGLIFRARSSLRNVAGFLIPMPILRMLAGTSAGGGAVTVAAAGGGGSGLVKLGATIGVAAVAIGSGVALHDRGGSAGNRATAKANDLPKVAVESGTDSASGAVAPASAGSATASAEGGSSASATDSGPSTSGSEGSGGGSGSGASGGSTGQSPVSGSSGSGDDLAGGSPGPGGGGGTHPGDDGGGNPGAGGGGPIPTDDGGSRDGSGGGLPPPPEIDEGGDGGHSGSGGGTPPPPVTPD